MTMMLAVIPFGMLAQSAQEVYAVADDIFSMSYAELETSINEDATEDYVTKEEMAKVDDLLLADPDFDVQENMITYTKDQKSVYFSANRKIKVKNGNEADVRLKKAGQLRLFKADVTENGEWINLEMLPFNGKKHSTGHPSLNKDDTKLFFVSDGPESTGKTDIFVVDLLEDGTYGKPSNLGPKINSAEREVFPMVDDSNVMFFTSDVETGGEEMNVFASRLIDDQPTAPVKLNVAVTGSREDYVAAFNAIDFKAAETEAVATEVAEAEAMRLAEERANLRDLEILLEAEHLAEIDRLEKELKNRTTEAAYDFEGSKVVYTVQIGAFLKEVKTETYRDSSAMFNHLYADGYNRFYSGLFTSEEDAANHMEQMKEKGFKDAFIVGLKGTDRFLPEK